MSQKKQAAIAPLTQQRLDKQDKIILLLEYLARSQSFGVELFYPDGERLGAKGSIEMCAEEAELLTRQGMSHRK